MLGAQIDALDWAQVIDTLLRWSERRESRYVCICNVHSVVTATQDVRFITIINAADLATPDGAPIAWMVAQLSGRPQSRINGPDLMWRLLGEMAARGQSVWLFGSTPATLAALHSSIERAYPSMRVAGAYSPALGVSPEVVDAAVVDAINNSGAGVVFVALGCPKQERWMATHRGRVSAVMIGVGAAFDFHAGTIRRAPPWMRNSGLEWLHRLVSEPRRLWKRYLISNTIFVYRAAIQLFRYYVSRH